MSKKNPAAVALGRLGGLKGGRARAQKLPDARRHEIASKAARVRWGTYTRTKYPTTEEIRKVIKAIDNKMERLKETKRLLLNLFEVE